MTLDEDVLKYLASTAMMAGAFGMRDKAIIIADALLAARPDTPDAQVLVASAKLAAGQKDAAIALLRDKVLVAEPERSDAKALLGVALHLQGLTAERDSMFEDVIKADDDANAVLIAKDIQGS